VDVQRVAFITKPPERFELTVAFTNARDDTPERAKLLAAQMSVEQMRDYINADSLAFISIEGLYRALGEERDAAQPQRCDACFTGAYPTSLTDVTEKEGAAGLTLVASR